MHEKKRIFVAGLHQESNSFSPVPTVYEDFRILRGDALTAKMAGVPRLQQAGCEIVPALYARAWPGGTVTLETFRRLVEEILAELPLDGSVDGVFMPMHGALDVEFLGSGDAVLLSMIRERVGPNVPIAAALDLHATNTYTFARLCNIMCGYRTAPHTDIDQTRERTAELLLRALETGETPWSELVRLPFMVPGENMMTADGPGRRIIEALPQLEQVPGVWCASFFAGIPWMDCPQGGSALVISGAGDRAPGLQAAEELGRRIWEMRGEFRFQGISMPPLEGLHYLEQQGQFPSILSDSADNVTAGSAGDNTYVLRMLLSEGTRHALVAGLIDAPAVRLCAAHRPGEVFALQVGGTLDPKGSARVELQAKLVRTGCSEEGDPRWAVVQTEGLDVLLFAQRGPVRSPAEMRSYGLDPLAYRMIVVKQGYLYPELRAMCRIHVMALTPGNSAQDLRLLHYSRTRWPMEPVAAVHDPARIAERYGG